MSAPTTVTNPATAAHALVADVLAVVETKTPSPDSHGCSAAFQAGVGHLSDAVAWFERAKNLEADTKVGGTRS